MRAGAGSALASRLDGLRRRYAEPHRAYHTQAHVDAMLRGLRDEAGQVTHPDAVELAIWYHDAIYDPAASDNEARSAALLRTELAGLADPALIAAAALMVEASARHRLPEATPDTLRDDAATFLDLDMAILGAAPADYDGYEAGIAAEYVPVHGEAAFRHGRRAFLNATLARDRLFLTDRFHAALDGPARANIARTLGPHGMQGPTQGA